jgi:hypothetical protein
MTEAERQQLLKEKEAELAIAYETKADAYAKSAAANAAYDEADTAYNKAVAQSAPDSVVKVARTALIAAKAESENAIFAAMDADHNVACAKAAFITASKAAKSE